MTSHRAMDLESGPGNPAVERAKESSINPKIYGPRGGNCLPQGPINS